MFIVVTFYLFYLLIHFNSFIYTTAYFLPHVPLLSTTYLWALLFPAMEMESGRAGHPVTRTHTYASLISPNRTNYNTMELAYYLYVSFFFFFYLLIYNLFIHLFVILFCSLLLRFIYLPFIVYVVCLFIFIR